VRGPELETAVLTGRAIAGVVVHILRLDREHMAPILAESGQAFPEEKRRAALNATATAVVVVRRGGEFIGYVDFTPSWTDPEDLYVGSLQVRVSHRRLGFESSGGEANLVATAERSVLAGERIARLERSLGGRPLPSTP
jgi:hypothetical protein